MNSRTITRRGISRIEVVVIGLVLFVLVMLALVVVSRIREKDRKTRCINNLKQLGLAFNTIAGDSGKFPTESTGQSVYVSLLEYVEEARQVQSWATNPRPVVTYLCPSRRNPSVGPKDDYGYGSSSGAGTSILDAPPGLTYFKIMVKRGANKTLLLAHKGMSPEYYNGTGPADTGWAALDHARDPTSNQLDTNDVDMSNLIGSPHPQYNLGVYADGHVGGAPYRASEETKEGIPLMSLFWHYNVGDAEPQIGWDS